MVKLKKLLSAICVLVVVVTAITSIKSSAAYEKAASQVFFDCDDLPVDLLPGTGVELDTTRKTQGNASIKVTTSSDNGTFGFGLTCEEADVSAYDYLYFDLYVENTDILAKINDLYYDLDGTVGEVSGRVRDADLGYYLMYQYTALVKDAWTTVAIPVSKLMEKGANLAHMNAFILQNFTGVWGGQQGQSFWIDNVRFGISMGDNVVCDCSVLPVDVAWSTAELVTDLGNTGNTSVKITPADGAKYLFNFSFPSFDATGYSYLKFDVYSDTPWVLRGTHFNGLRLNNSNVTFDTINYLRNEANDIPQGKWKTYCIPTSEIAAAGMDLTAVSRFMLYNDNGAWAYKDGDGVSFYIDNIRFSNYGDTCEHTGNDFVIGKSAASILKNGATGDKYCKTCGEIVLDSAVIHALGDLNGDGTVDVLDLIRMKKHVAGITVELASGTGDVDGDTRIDSADLSVLRKAMLTR